jgi:hypothetical protein
MRRCRFSSLPCRASLRQLRQPPPVLRGEGRARFTRSGYPYLAPRSSGSPRETGLSFHIFTAISRKRGSMDEAITSMRRWQTSFLDLTN